MPTLSKLEIEIRRRLWWQIIFLDSRSRSKRTPGLSASDTMFDTKTPSHMLEDGKGAFLDPSNAQNQSIVCIIRCEVWLLCRFLNANRPNSLEQKLDAFNRTRSRLETLYMSSVSSNHALTSLVKTMTSLVLSKVEHAIYLQHLHNLKELSQMPSQEMMQHQLDLSIDILKQAHCLRTESSWKRWRWQLQGDFPWTSMSVVFIQLCQSPWSAISERGWALTHLILEEAQDNVKLSPSWSKLNKLIIAAEAHRGRNPAEGTLRARSQNKTLTASFNNTEESISGVSKASVTQSDNTHIPLDYPESNQAAFDNGSEIDESNKFESGMAFYPMEWHPWDEVLTADNEFWDFDFANVEESLEL